MSIGSYIIFFFLILSGLIILSASLKSERFFRSVVLSAVSGTGSRFAVKIATAVTGVSLSVILLPLLISGRGGVPGTVFLLLSDVILNKV